jgi:ribosome-associated protein YbcJ (S4-like RNA binding protein)
MSYANSQWNIDIGSPNTGGHKKTGLIGIKINCNNEVLYRKTCLLRPSKRILK